MIITLKIIILVIQFSYLYHSLKNNAINSIIYKKKFNSTKCNHLYEYSKVEKFPTNENEGKKWYMCKYCRKKYYENIPKLNKKNYKIEKISSNCQNGNGIRYYSKLYGQYELTDNEKKLHSIYGKKCEKCKQLIGEFDFKSLGPLKCTGYPRLIRLSDHWNNNWLLGGNFGNNVGCRISKDQGLTWSDPIDISKFPDYVCSNIDLFELPNHDIISSFRAIGRHDNPDENIKYNRKLGCSISHDGGYTWENIGSIIDNFELAKKLGKTRMQAIKAVKDEEKVGFFEPFVMLLNNEISVFYADDFTPMINHTINDDPYYNYMVQNIYTQTYDIKGQKWSEDRNIIMDGSIKKSPTNSGLIKRISRDGMPVATTMKDGTYVLIFEGTYRDRDYPLLTGTYLGHHKWFEIVLSYSKDGINWSNPVEIYVSKNNGTKSSAPFILCNDQNQLIVSFQTDEESYDLGYDGDIYSIMKVMISKPGIPIEEINQYSFYALCNNNNSPIGSLSNWNGMMLYGNKLYTVSSENTIKYSEIPIYEEPKKYNEKLRKNYYIKKGIISTYGDQIISESNEIFIINKNIDTFLTNNFYTYITPNCESNVGLVFGIKNFELVNEYYIFQINEKGNLSLIKNENGKYKNLENKIKYIENFNKNNTYKMEISFNPKNGNIITYINDQLIYLVKDKSLNGKLIGFISHGKNTIIKQIIAEENEII
jgi:hypothetical protein